MESSKLEESSAKDDSMGNLMFIRSLGEDLDTWLHQVLQGLSVLLMLALTRSSCCRVTVLHLQKSALSGNTAFRLILMNTGKVAATL